MRVVDFGGQEDGTHGALERQAAGGSVSFPADTDMDAKLSEAGLSVRRYVRHHRGSHVDATGHSIRVAGRTRPAREYTSG